MKLRTMIQTAATAALMLVSVAVPAVALGVVGGNTPAHAVEPSPKSTVQDGVNSVGGKNQTPLATVIKNVINILLYIVGVAAVIMIVIGGLRYVLSGGDSNAVTGAKNTVLYSVVGLIVAVMSYALVNFVLIQF